MSHITFVIIDRLTIWYFLPSAHPFRTVKVAQIFMDKVIKLHGWPIKIISDRNS